MQSDRPTGSNGKLPVQRAGRAIAWALVLCVGLELALQVRSHLRFGQSVFNLAVEKPLYQRNAELNLTLLTPGVDHQGSLARITANSRGLRSPELPEKKAPGEYRVAVIGASSVMGAYSRTNAHTLSAFLEQRLRQAYPDRTIHVINAGIAGASLIAEQSMVRYVAPMQPDLLVLYTGFNDLAAYCRKHKERSAARTGSWRLPGPDLPKFLLTTDLLLKNTVFLRGKPETPNSHVDPKSIDTSHFEEQLDLLLQVTKATSARAVVSTVARAHRPGQPEDEQRVLASTALYYLPCFTLSSLSTVHDRHNAILREQAAVHQLPVINMEQAVPGGARYFADANHFTEVGERLAADAIFEAIGPLPAIAPAPRN